MSYYCEFSMQILYFIGSWDLKADLIIAIDFRMCTTALIFVGNCIAWFSLRFAVVKYQVSVSNINHTGVSVL